MGLVQNVKKQKRSPLARFFAIIALLFVCALILGIILFVIFTYQISNKVDEYDDSVVFNLAQNSKIYADDGETVLAELQIENREPVSSLSDISPNVLKATLSVEDARFYQHNGVDNVALLRAASVILTGGDTQGGSTITMQLVRNTILSNEAQTITLERKISEIILAKRIEEIYSKDEILLMYLNTINYGDRCYGIKAASKHYFSMDPSELDLNQASTLAGIPQSPTYLSPTNNESACTQRRNIVLYRMWDDHVITDAEYDQIKSSPIELNVSYHDPTASYKYPYFTNYVRQQILEKYSSSEIFEGGFQIYTSLNIQHQEACENGCEKSNKQLEKNAESVAVTMDPSNGHITGMVGGSDYNTNQYNIATSKGRPTGSSFKMFTLATAIEQGYDPYSFTLDCSSPMNVGTVQIKNVSGISYGYKTIQGATAVSSNTGFVRLQQKLDTSNVIDMARKLGIKDAELPKVTTLTLGVADINPVEMASAYATVANGGIYYEPVSILRITTASGDEIFNSDDNDNPENGKRVIDKEVAGAVTKVLKTVFSEGTAKSACIANGQPVAGKTGTSEDWRDHTLIGYTPDLVLSTWIGKRDYTPTSQSVTCNYLFKTIMDQIYTGSKTVDFPETDKPKYTKSGSGKSSWYDDYDDAPDVSGLTLQEAKSKLYNYDITIYYVFSNTVPSGTVVSQRQENSRIVINVSKGPNSE